MTTIPHHSQSYVNQVREYYDSMNTAYLEFIGTSA